MPSDTLATIGNTVGWPVFAKQPCCGKIDEKSTVQDDFSAFHCQRG
jgi:hypothetical protein